MVKTERKKWKPTIRFNSQRNSTWHRTTLKEILGTTFLNSLQRFSCKLPWAEPVAPLRKIKTVATANEWTCSFWFGYVSRYLYLRQFSQLLSIQQTRRTIAISEREIEFRKHSRSTQ